VGGFLPVKFNAVNKLVKLHGVLLMMLVSVHCEPKLYRSKVTNIH
jgi:hypothetical protein